MNMRHHFNSSDQISDWAKLGFFIRHLATTGGQQVLAILNYKIHYLFVAKKQLLYTSKLIKSHMSASALYFFLSCQQNRNSTCNQYSNQQMHSTKYSHKVQFMVSMNSYMFQQQSTKTCSSSYLPWVVLYSLYFIECICWFLHWI
jgi:hypothetical protein